MKINFGDISPGESKLAWWEMVTSIDGTFTEFTGEYIHSSELGGMGTSLIKQLNTNIIHREIDTGDVTYDLLVTPKNDETYYLLLDPNTGSSTPVSIANYTVVSSPTPDNPNMDIGIEDLTGKWVIVSIEDPYDNKVPILKVIRERDGSEIAPYNYWMRNGRILIVDHYTEGFDGKYKILYSTPAPSPTPTPTPTPAPQTGKRVGIQAGHWQYDSGAIGCDGQTREVDINLAVANKSAEILRQRGYTVDVLPSASAPNSPVPGYTADAFVALHADYCAGENTGFKVSRYGGAKGTGKLGNGDASDQLVDSLWSAYGVATGLPYDTSPGHFTDNMIYYNALNLIAKSTPGAIIEMGWLSGDLAFMTSAEGQQKMATGIANAVDQFLHQAPNPLSDLKQLKSDGTTQIIIGGATDERTVIFSANVNDPDGNKVKLQVELRRLDEYDGKFDETKGGLKESGLVASGSTATTSAIELIYGSYHWRARTIDEHGKASDWVEFGNNPTSDADFIVVKQIIKLLIVPTNYTRNGKYHGMTTPEDIDKLKDLAKKSQEFYLKSSYGSIYLEFDFYDPIITLRRNWNFMVVVRDVLEQCPNCFDSYDTLVVVNETYDYERSAKGEAFPARSFEKSYPIAVVPFIGDDFGTWVHEIGHTLGYTVKNSTRHNNPNTLLWDLYYKGKIGGLDDNRMNLGNVYWWDLMGYGANVYDSKEDNRKSQPTDMSSLSKTELGWLTREEITKFGSYPITSLENMHYGGSALVFKPPNSEPRGYEVEYSIEARELLQPSLGELRYFEGLRYLEKLDQLLWFNLENGIIIYKNKTYPDGNVSINVLSNSWLPIPHDPTFLANEGTSAKPYTDINHFVKFSVSASYLDYPYRAEIQISPCDICKSIKGVVLTITKPPLWLLTPSWNPAYHNLAYPDLDLHAYTTDGKHVGMNYTSGEYEMQILGAFTSGDLINGEEWIFVPKDTQVSYYVSSHDVQKYLEENPDVDATNATMEYITIFMEYGENPQRVQLPDGNWTVTNRTVSEPQMDTIEPGIIKEKLVDITPPTTTAVFSGNLGNNDWYTSDVQVNLTAADNEGGSGVNTTEYSFDNATWTTYTAPFAITNEGTTTLYYRSTDSAGNIEPTRIQVIKIDKTPPASITSLQATAGESWLNWTWTNPTDSDFNHTEIYLNSTFLTNTSAPQTHYNATGLTPDTLYELSTRTVDTSGNINSTWVNATARTLAAPDTVPPVITNVSAASGTDSAVITWDTDEASDSLVKYGTSSGSLTLFANSSEMALKHSLTLSSLAPDTIYYYVVNSTDAQGSSNESTEHTFRTLAPADDVPPVIDSITLFPASTTAGSLINISVLASDNVGVAEVTADGSHLTYSDGLWQGSITAASSAGSYTVNIRAKDAANNVAESTAAYTVVAPTGGLGVGISPMSTTVTAPATINYNIRIKSTENIDDIIRVYVSMDGLSSSYHMPLTWFNWTEKNVKLSAGSETVIPLTLNIPSDAAGKKAFRIKAESILWTSKAQGTAVITIS